MPLFIDIDPKTLAYNLRLVEELFWRKDVVGAILTHNLGFPYGVDPLAYLASIKGKWLVNDCCDALGSREHGDPVGRFGDLSTLSFFPAHHITTGEGGSVQTNNSKLYRLLQSIVIGAEIVACSPVMTILVIKKV